jgi:hypothetical protein
MRVPLVASAGVLSTLPLAACGVRIVAGLTAGAVKG